MAQPRCVFYVDGRNNISYTPAKQCTLRCENKHFVFFIDGAAMNNKCQEIRCTYDDHVAIYQCTVVLQNCNNGPTQFTMDRRNWNMMNDWLQAQDLADLHSKDTPLQGGGTARQKMWSFLDITEGSISGGSDGTDGPGSDALISIKSFNPYLVQLT